MRAEVAGGGEATPLEVLLAGRVVACWLLVELLDALMSAQLNPEARSRSGGASFAFLRDVVKMQESAHRRYLSAIQALARVRRLQVAAPAVQVNTQVNVVEGGGDGGMGARSYRR
jgi:hypothetical protein